MKTIKQLTIDESKWGWGNLYDSNDGTYCALGFACKAAGVSGEEMDGETLPEDLDANLPKWMFNNLPKNLVDEMMTDVDAAYRNDSNEFQQIVPLINDADDISRDEKKSRLKKIFKFVGINLHFKNSDKSIMMK